MIIDILTLFPKMFQGPFSESIIKRAQEKGLVKINIHNLRDWATDKRKTVDDRPYGGGPGMVMKVEPFDKALQDLGVRKWVFDKETKTYNLKPNTSARVILLTPSGKVFNQSLAKKLSRYPRLVLLCGHYEGIDERVKKLVDEEISIGEYVLTGGEIPAMVIVDTVVRLIPGVVGKKESLEWESFSTQPKRLNILNKRNNSTISTREALLEYPQYTRPEVYKGMKVPQILLTGDHKKIAEWRLKKAIERTRKRKPDLLK
jgi:tRNA (guanine37-N1)-methyltransferase